MESMMEKLCGTRTEENLRTAFAGESQARNKYTYYAKKAEEDGMNQIAEIFRITALNEEQHAKIWFKLLNDGIGSTEENLKNAAEGEHFEWAEMYADFAKTAEEEGFANIARLFSGVAAIEKSHEQRFLTLERSVREGGSISKWGGDHCLDLPQLWAYRCGKDSAAGLPGVRPSTGVLPAPGGKLLM